MTVKFKVFAFRDDWIQSPDNVLKMWSSPLPLSALFSSVFILDSLFSHGGKVTTTRYQLLLHSSKTTTSNKGPGPDSQSQIRPQAQP